MPAGTPHGPGPRRPVLDAWREAFVLELRSRDVPGARIGDALAEVDSHCAETGQDPEAGFGDPVTYATELSDSLPPAARSANVSYGGLVVVALTVYSGVSLLLTGLDGVVGGRGATFAWGSLVGLLVCGAVCVAVTLHMSALMRRGRLRWLFAVLAAGPILPVVAVALAPRAAVTLPAWPCLLLGAVLLGVGAGLASRRGSDLVIDPRTGTESFGPSRAVTLLAAALLPAVLVMVVVLVLVAGR